MPLAYGPQERHPMVDALLRTRVPRWEALNLAIDERDDMLDFAITLFEHDRDRALVNYFQNALEQFTLVRHIARWRGGRPRRMLDFASGYGRLTRLLVHERFADEVTVSDILEGGMEFQREQFGVRTVVSQKQPEDFAAPERYDLIFVASLFTHLPPATFTRWLRRLAGLLEPEGLLIFSVHDQSIAPAAVDGIAFQSFSESRVLDVEDYGSTWVTEEYVRGQVATLGAYDCIRLPRALSDWQDVYVISPAPIPNATPRPMAKGFVDQFAVVDEGVRISGWATGVGERIDRIEVRLDDELMATVRKFEARADVAAWLGTPDAAESGWQVLLPHTAVRSFRYQVASVSAFTRASEERLLFLGTIESLHGHVAQQKAKHLEQELVRLDEQLAAAAAQRHALEQEIAAMKQSRFWRAREQWFALKRGVGLTDER